MVSKTTLKKVFLTLDCQFSNFILHYAFGPPSTKVVVRYYCNFTFDSQSSSPHNNYLNLTFISFALPFPFSLKLIGEISFLHNFHSLCFLNLLRHFQFCHLSLSPLSFRSSQQSIYPNHNGSFNQQTSLIFLSHQTTHI